MSEITQHHCLNCGGTLTDVGGDTLKCKYCGSTFENRSLERKLQSMQELLDQAKLEYVNNQRRNLYDAVHAKYVSMSEVRQYATEIKKHLPDDFQANFYLQTLSGDAKEINRIIRRIDVDANYDSLPAVIHFLIASLQIEYLLELNNLIERAYKKRDLPLFSRYATEISEEAEKVSEGVYATEVPRDVFIAYSSKDMDKVSELCEELESQGISCFVAARNLRHGVGAVENYDSALKEAMDNCRCFVFVSSVNSRSLSCDAVTKEIPYIRGRDIENAPAHLRNNYSAIPDIYKKPRVEYRIGNEKSSDAVSRITDAFFEGHEWTYTPADVAVRIVKMLYEEPAPAPVAEAISIMPAAQQPTKKKSKAPIIAVASILLAGAVTVGALVVPGLVNQQADEPGVNSSLNGESNGQASAGGNTTKGNEAAKPGNTPADNETITSHGLAFTPIGYKVCVVSGIGTCTDTDLVIPAQSPSGDSVVGIDDQAFIGAYTLTSVSIPEGVKEIGDSAFLGCSNLRWFDLPDSLTTINDNAFFNCTSLSSIEIPAGVINIGKTVFGACHQIRTITVDPGNTRFEGVFNCLIDKSTKTLIRGCQNSSIPTDGSVTEIGEDAFNGIPFNQEITIPDEVVSIGDRAFLSCAISGDLYISANVRQIGEQAFSHNYIDSITVDPKNTRYSSSGNCLIEPGTKTVIYGCKNSVIPSDGSVTYIGDYAFYLCIVPSLQIPEGIKAIGDHAFESTSNLKDIHLPNSITSIGTEAFFQSSALTSVTLSNQLISIGDHAFSYCEKLTSINIPASVTEIGKNPFAQCTLLETITADSGNTKYHAQGNCLIETATQTLISGCIGSTIPADGSVTHIGNEAFQGLSSLTSITIPDVITHIEEAAFYRSGLTSISLPNSVTHISRDAFNSCENLISAYLPAGLVSIENNSLHYQIKDIYYAGTQQRWHSLVTMSNYTWPTSALIHFNVIY